MIRDRQNAASVDDAEPAKTQASRFGNLKFAERLGQLRESATHEFVLYDGRRKGKGLFPTQVTQRA